MRTILILFALLFRATFSTIADELCDMPPLPLQERLDNRSFPSLFTPWGFTPVNQPNLSDVQRMAQHDLYFCCIGMFYGLDHRDTGNGWRVRGDVDYAIRQRDEYIARNPNMLFLTTIDIVWEHPDAFPKDSSYWLRDDEGRIETAYEDKALLDLNHPEVQQLMIERVVVIARCGLYDGVHFDAWIANHPSQIAGQVTILKGIRTRVRDEFLILVNTNRWTIPDTAPYINGSFLESGLPSDDAKRGGDGISAGFTHMEQVLFWAEQNFRSPQINSLLGFGFGAEPMDSPTNQRYMRAVTTLNLTFSDGYFMYYLPGPDGATDTGVFSGFYWYDFWDADLGCREEREDILPEDTPQPGIPTLDLKWRDTNRISSYWSFGITASEPLPEPIALRINMLAHVYDAGEIRKVWYEIGVTFKQGDLNT